MAKHRLRKFVEEHCANYGNHPMLGGWGCWAGDTYTEQDGFKRGRCRVIYGKECAYFNKSVMDRANFKDKDGTFMSEKWFDIKDEVDKLEKAKKKEIPLTQIHTHEQLSQFIK